MNEELTYDPRTKQLIKDKLYAFLYDPVENDFKKRLKTIIVKNSQLHGNSQYWLSYKGINYSADKSTRAPRPMNRLKPELKDVMDDYIADLDRLNNTELPYVLGYITQALNLSNSFQDYLRMFPVSLHRPLKELIEKCGCRVELLEDDSVEGLKHRNRVPIELMKKRMVLNLLI